MKTNGFQSLLVIVTGFLVLAYVFPGGRQYWVAAAMTVGLLGLISAVTRNAVLWVWEKLALVLGWINSRILLSAVYIIFLVPIGLLFRVFKGDPLSIRRPPLDSLFVQRDHKYTREDLEHPW
jgi:hypothetical protein